MKYNEDLLDTCITLLFLGIDAMQWYTMNSTDIKNTIVL